MRCDLLIPGNPDYYIPFCMIYELTLSFPERSGTEFACSRCSQGWPVAGAAKVKAAAHPGSIPSGRN